MIITTSIFTYIDENDLSGLERLIKQDKICMSSRKGSLGSTPLISACLSLKIEIIKLLLGKGADIYAANVWQRNALHEVVSNLVLLPEIESDKIKKLWTIARLLLEREAQLIREDRNPTIRLLESRTNIGLTPLDIAIPRPEVYAKLLGLIDEVRAEFEMKADLQLAGVEKQSDELHVAADAVEKRDDLRLFSQPQITTGRSWSAKLFHRRRVPSEEKAPLINHEPISVDGDKFKPD